MIDFAFCQQDFQHLIVINISLNVTDRCFGNFWPRKGQKINTTNLSGGKSQKTCKNKCVVNFHFWCVSQMQRIHGFYMCIFVQITAFMSIYVEMRQSSLHNWHRSRSSKVIVQLSFRINWNSSPRYIWTVYLGSCQKHKNEKP